MQPSVESGWRRRLGNVGIGETDDHYEFELEWKIENEALDIVFGLCKVN
jgi:hypothetical protein